MPAPAAAPATTTTGASASPPAMIMYSNQAGLPPLPLPTVAETMERYLRVLKPLTTTADYAAAERHAAEFTKSKLAAELQAHLTRQQHVVPNWLERLWSDSYLMGRSSPGVHVSPVLGFDFKHVGAKVGRTGVKLGAFLCETALEFHISIDQGQVKPNTVRGKPLCMEDFSWCFGTTRVPAVGRDIMVKASPPRATHAHCVVMCNGWPFVLPLKGTGGWLASRSFLERSLERIVRLAENAGHSCVGALTYLPRDDWAAVRAKMLLNDVNRLALHEIESALFVLSLDNVKPGDDNSDTIHALMHGHLAGEAEAKSWNDLNRWWDKGLHLHTSRDGRGGLTFEHSAQDSLPILTLTSMIAAKASKPEALVDVTIYSATPQDEQFAPEMIRFDYDHQPELYAAVQRGRKLLADTLAKLSVTVKVAPLRTGRFRQLKLSPDAAVQAALQVGFRQARGFTPSTYESASTKTYLHGRTETLRPLTAEMAKLTEALSKAIEADSAGAADSGPSMDEIYQLFAAASARHAESARLAASGQGCDRHLFGLYCAAKELGLKLPAVLNDNAFRVFNNITLSTTHPFWQKGTRLVGFGPVVSPVCVGCGYFVTPSDVTMGVSTWREEAGDISSARAAGAAGAAIKVLQKAVDAAQQPDQPASSQKDSKLAPRAKL